jgi:TonB family protein
VARRSLGCCLGLWVMGCATPEAVTQTRTAARAVESVQGPTQAEAESAERPAVKRRKTVKPSTQAAREEQKVAVDGIEGTLSRFDVDVALEKRGKEFARCHESRARRVPALAGNVAFQIHVLRSGEVGDVNVSESDLGDRALERCLSEAIQAARFPAPNGGEADITWRMLLEPAGRRRQTEQWPTARVERVLRKRQGALLETCDAERLGPFRVTAYVSRSGRVLAAGVAARQATAPATIDCIADGLRSWSMPKPRKSIAKVSFPLRTGA